MIEYRVMDSTLILPSCLHKGPIPLAQGRHPAAFPAYIETISDIPQGSVARALLQQCARFGFCGLAAIDNDMVVGKIRVNPQALADRVPARCVQQEQPVRDLLAVEIMELPEQRDILHLDCMQVAQEYWGQGIAGQMLTALIDVARRAGWQQLNACAGSPIRPLLAWSGQLSRQSLERRGFVVLHEAVSKDLREGVIAQRGGYHGEEVRMQWEAYAHISDDEASRIFEMALDL